MIKIMNRTGIDFSKHIVEITNQKGLLVHHFRIPGKYINSIKFINTNGIMCVTGDFGNWMFCREFHPSKEGHVSDDYWHEKLRISSCQNASVFDSEATEEYLKEGIKSSLEEYGYTDDKLLLAKEYYEECLSYVSYSEFEYTAFAYQNIPSFMDAEEVPFIKDIKHHLKIVFDGFDEICRRMKEDDSSFVLMD